MSQTLKVEWQLNKDKLWAEGKGMAWSPVCRVQFAWNKMCQRVKDEARKSGRISVCIIFESYEVSLRGFK